MSQSDSSFAFSEGSIELIVFEGGKLKHRARECKAVSSPPTPLKDG